MSNNFLRGMFFAFVMFAWTMVSLTYQGVVLTVPKILTQLAIWFVAGLIFVPVATQINKLAWVAKSNAWLASKFKR